MLRSIQAIVSVTSRSPLFGSTSRHYTAPCVVQSTLTPWFLSQYSRRRQQFCTMSKRPEKISQFRLNGITSAPVTPFKANGDLNLDVYDKYVQHMVDFGISNVFAIGSTGEGNNMTVAERKQAAEAWLKAGRGKLKGILIHIGAGNIRESQELARHAHEIGADAIACVGPSYFKPQTQECYVQYMAEVAAVAPELPFYLYDINFMTGINFDVNEFFTLAKGRIPTLRGVKHTSPIFPSMNTLVLNHPDMQIILGSNEIFLQALSIGMGETICDSFQGLLLGRVKEAFEKGDIESARFHQSCALKICNIRKKHALEVAAVAPELPFYLYDINFMTGINWLNVPGGTKAVLRAIGVDFEVGNPRLALSPIPQETIHQLRQELKEIGFFEWGVPKK